VAPKWLRLYRTDGHDFTAQMSDDGVTWRFLQSVTLPIDGPMLEGIAVTSHTTSATLATAVFEDVSVEPLLP
jgi:regulation of enolase protein 1 (concanavalin A-like superfamily)